MTSLTTIDYGTQQRKLRSKPWATTVLVIVGIDQAGRGRLS